VVAIADSGYGAALNGGIQVARGRYVIMGDADDSYDFSALMPFVERLRSGVDVVMGNRFKGGIALGAMPTLHKYLGNPVLSFVGRLFFHLDVGDFHCGLRGFDRDRVRALNLRTTGMEFASEMVVRAALADYRIEEVPTNLQRAGRSRRPHLRTWRDGWRHLSFLLIYSPRWLFLYTGLFLLAFGLFTAFALLPGAVKVGNIAFDIHTFVVACIAVLVGIQALSFGAVARGVYPRTGFGGRRHHRVVRRRRRDRLHGAMGIHRFRAAGIYETAASPNPVIDGDRDRDSACAHRIPVSDRRNTCAIAGRLT
jgi:hypothetical protein